MKNFSYLFMAGLMTLGLWSCSDDADITAGGENEISADKVYMSFKLELPTASRSKTDDGIGSTNSNADPDSEVGHDVENMVSKLTVVLATKKNNSEYSYVTKATGGTDFDNPSASSTSYSVTFQSAQLEEVAGTNVAVFVFCNYPDNINYSEAINGSIMLNDIQTSIWESSYFWMSNADVSMVELDPINELKKHNTIDKAFDLGDINVERTAARFDFKQLGDKVDDVYKTDNKYTLEGDVADPNIQIKLTDLALVNMSNQFYHLRRVSVGNDINNMVIGGKETSTNYVVDSDASQKSTAKYLPNNFNFGWNIGATGIVGENIENATFNFGEWWNSESTNSAKQSIESLSLGDNWNTEDYRIWRYATENTLPTISQQIKSLSTGVIFRGELICNDGSGRLDGENRVYVHNNVLYGNWEQVKAKVASILDGETDPRLLALKLAYNSVTNNGVDVDEPELSEAAAQGFTVYTPEGADKKYYVYYYYMNRHNDNGKSEDMGPMEFAVVRNNVYKLAVTNINKYGHPGDPAGDPDPEIPTDPDEEKNVYFTVSVKVLPWVVRVNNIEF